MIKLIDLKRHLCTSTAHRVYTTQTEKSINRDRGNNIHLKKNVGNLQEIERFRIRPEVP